MPVLSAASRKPTALSPPLPIPNKILNSAGIVLRRGQFSLLAAAPGTGKTLAATNIALFTPVPVVYFSADSDEYTVRQRACSILTGTPLATVEQHLNSSGWDDYYAQHLRTVDHVDWCFQTDIEMEFVVHRLQAHAEMRGEYPHLVVLDNLGNTVTDQENEYAELRGTCREIQRIARSINAHVIALHHVKGPKENGTTPIGLGDLLGNLGKIPEQVLGMSRAGENEVCLTVPKNRGGRSGVQINLPIDYTTATVGGFR